MGKLLSVLLIFVLILSCKEKSETKVLSADEIINKSIEVSGGIGFDNSIIQFYFRDRLYIARRQKGEFNLSRAFKENNDSITDFISNSGFKRMIAEEFIKVEDSMAIKYTASINSVHYFSVLPFGLNDKAVRGIFLNEEQIKNKNYYKIKVTFNEDGGGEDYEDVYVYWVDKAFFKVDYLAYSYNENDDIGMRFREAYNERYVNGLRFVDYNNYKSQDSEINLIDLGKAFENNQLTLISKIELENVSVRLIYN